MHVYIVKTYYTTVRILVHNEEYNTCIILTERYHQVCKPIGSIRLFALILWDTCTCICCEQGETQYQDISIEVFVKSDADFF